MPKDFSIMYLWFRVKIIHDATIAMATEARITATKAMVLEDFNPFLRASLEEQVEPSKDSQRFGFSRNEFEVRVLKNGVTGIGPEKLLYEIFNEVRLVRKPKIEILRPVSLFFLRDFLIVLVFEFFCYQ